MPTDRKFMSPVIHRNEGGNKLSESDIDEEG